MTGQSTALAQQKPNAVCQRNSTLPRSSRCGRKFVHKHRCKNYHVHTSLVAAVSVFKSQQSQEFLWTLNLPAWRLAVVNHAARMSWEVVLN